MPRAKSPIKKLERLTPDQLAILPRKRDEWIAVGLNTEPIDLEGFKRGLSKAYGVIGKPAPRIVIVLPSWRACNYAASIVLPMLFDKAQVGDQVKDQVSDQVSDQVADQVGEQVWEQVRDQVVAQVADQVVAQVAAQVRAQVAAQVADQVAAQVGAQVKDQVWDQVSDQVGAQVVAHVRAQVSDQVADQVVAQVRAQVRDQVVAQVAYQVGEQVAAQVERFEYSRFWNQFESGWFSFYDTMDELGVDVSKLDGLMEMARSAGPSWLWWDIALVSDRPMVIHRDERNRLHSASGPALVYRDGSCVWAYHGVRVPEYVIACPHEITVEKIETEANAEIRRVMIEQFGAGRFVTESKLAPLHADDFGTLYQRVNPDGSALTLVRVVDCVKNDDGSDKVHYLPVNAELRPMRLNEDSGEIEYGAPQELTARNAVASTFGLQGKEYSPTLET